jgi:PAS domain S-box-containing protein
MALPIPGNFLVNDMEVSDPHTAAQLLPPLVYDDLRRLAGHRLRKEVPGQALQPAALAHEAYHRLLKMGVSAHWDDRAHRRRKWLSQQEPSQSRSNADSHAIRIDRTAMQSSSPPSLGLLQLLALSAMLFCGPLPAVAAAENIRLVAVLYPDNNDGSPGNFLVDESIRATFATGSPDRVEIHNEYLDVSPARNGEFKQLQAEFLRQKYAGRKVDLVITGLSSGLDFALEHRHRIFPGVPIVFCAVDQREAMARKLSSDVVGVPLKMDLIATLDLALRLHPNTERVFIIAGKAKFDADWEAEARQAFRVYEDKLEFVYLTKLPLEDLLQQVAHLPDRSIIYYLHVHQDGAGNVLVPSEVLVRLAAKANAPIYGHVSSYVGRGIVGGRVFSWETEGTNAAKLGLRILAGEKPENIGVQNTSANTYLFDWRQLQRWGIREDSLPPGSVVRHRETSFWDLYRWHICGVVSLCVVQALLIVGLLVQRANRRRAEERFLQAVEAAPNGMVLVEPTGHIVLANTHMERLFGYRKEEMLGQPVEMLVPQRFRKEHPGLRDRFFASPGIRSMGAGRDLFGCRKDCSDFPVEVGLSPIQTEGGLFALASVIDITERKRAETALRESESRFRLMADTAPVMVWMSGPDKLCTYFNKPWLDFTGRPQEREIGDGWSEGVHSDDLQRCLETYSRAFDARQSFRMEYRLRRFDGEYRWVLDVGVPRFKSDGAFEGYIGSAIDITDEKQVEQALRESQRELRLLTGRLLQAQETERSRIARELHDDLGQSLALLSVEMDLLGRKPPESAAQLSGPMQEFSARVKQLSSSVHDLSHKLHPSKLEQLGLVAAVGTLCKDLAQAHGVSIAFTARQVPDKVSAETALCLYRIVQEALRNVIKHSGAHQASVELQQSTDALCLRIVDDGAGFDPANILGGGGLGLVSIRERLHLVRGQVAIDSRPSGGTRIDVRIPLCGNGQAEDGLPAHPAGIG